jgi:hypothetical protein
MAKSNNGDRVTVVNMGPPLQHQNVTTGTVRGRFGSGYNVKMDGDTSPGLVHFYDDAHLVPSGALAIYGSNPPANPINNIGQSSAGQVGQQAAFQIDMNALMSAAASIAKDAPNYAVAKKNDAICPGCDNPKYSQAELAAKIPCWVCGWKSR